MSLQISGYEFIEAMQGGDLADEVWKARRAVDGRLAVVKILPELGAGDPAAAEQFLQEAQRLQSLQHPGLVSVLDAGIKLNRPFYVTEFIEGDSLRELIERRGAIAENDALLLGQGVAAALAYAWKEARLFHGHLTPGNVLIDRQDVVRLADLGLGRLVRGIAAAQGRSAPRRHAAPHYAAPEQALPDSVVDFRADIYALGMVLHHLLTGAVPFGESSDAEALSRHVTGFLPDPRERRHRVSDGCVWLLERCTAKDPAARPADWAVVLADLAAVRNGLRPAGERPAPGAATVQRNERKTAAPSRRPAPAPAPVLSAAAAKSPPVFDRSGLSAAVVEASAGRQRVVVSPQLHRQLASLRRRRSRSASRFSIGLLIALAGLVYVVWRYIGPSLEIPGLSGARDAADDAGRDRGAPRGTVRRGPDGTPIRDGGGAYARPTPPGAGTPQLRAIPESPAGTNGGAAGAGSRHPDFVAGARAFNEALALFKQFEQDRNGSVLPRVDRLSQTAAQRFEAYVQAHPNDPAGRRYVDQSYGMIRYARQTMLMAGIRDTDDRDPPRRTSAPARTLPGTVARGLRLAPGWNVPSSAAGPAMRDLWLLLGSRGNPAMNLAPDPTLNLLEKVPYLQPAGELARRWNIELPAGQTIRNPAFPDRSLKAHAIVREVLPPYPAAVLITDMDGSVVGLQVYDDRPAERPGLPAALFAEQWTVYDFVGLRLRADTGQRIAHRVRPGDRVIRIDTELAETDPSRPDGLGRSLYRSSLFLPQPIVDLMIFRIYTARNAPPAG